MRHSRGQALVEFALIFPFLFFLLAVSIDVFRVDWAPRPSPSRETGSATGSGK